jgi:hypothetical protein|tara:strand:+ start:1618 stop:1881 length:264 start_codon:yes stop_codon:yes gene_type:complete
MALKKQSIRSNQLITENGEPVSKEELIARSEEWSEIQENFFRKMLKQGGSFKVAGIKYKVELIERNDLDSNGNKPVNLPPLPGERTF